MWSYWTEKDYDRTSKDKMPFKNLWLKKIQNTLMEIYSNEQKNRYYEHDGLKRNSRTKLQTNLPM